MSVWYSPKFDEIHLILPVNEFLSGTLIGDMWFELSWPNDLVYIGGFE